MAAFHVGVESYISFLIVCFMGLYNVVRACALLNVGWPVSHCGGLRVKPAGFCVFCRVRPSVAEGSATQPHEGADAQDKPGGCRRPGNSGQVLVFKKMPGRAAKFPK